MLRPEAPVGSKKGSDCEDGLGLPEKVVTKASRSVIPETRLVKSNYLLDCTKNTL